MSYVFKNQTLLTIVLETNYDNLASADVTRIIFTKPNGQNGYWEATVSGTTLSYQVQEGDIDRSGLWQFQSYIEIGGLKAPGDIVTIDFKVPLQ